MSDRTPVLTKAPKEIQAKDASPNVFLPRISNLEERVAQLEKKLGLSPKKVEKLENKSEQPTSKGDKNAD